MKTNLAAADKKYLNDVCLQLKLQCREPISGPGGHPDPVVRVFFRSLFKTLKNKHNHLQRNLLVEVHQNRPSLNETHFVNLYFRTIQYLFRLSQRKDYLQFTEATWENYLLNFDTVYINKVKKILLSYNTATHVPSRYRSFNTALRIIISQNPNFDLKVADVGCSLGLGIKACLANGFLSSPKFIDKTPGQQILSSFEKKIKNCSRAIGIDIKVPTLEWVKACNYPSKYDFDSKSLDIAISKLSDLGFKVLVKQSNILDPTSISTLTGGKSQLTAICSSMSMYELSFKDQQLARRHIAKSLCDGGVYIEFTFRNPDNWFKGIHTIVRVNSNGVLSKGYVWHLWSDSRCSEVRQGKDFYKVNKILKTLGQKK